MLFLHILILAILIPTASLENTEKFFLRVKKEAIQHGFDYDKHEIITEDGYILTTFRMRKKNETVISIPVLIAHGMYARSDLFMMLGPQKSLAYFLAQNGFDVWLMNARGNTYSKKHLELNPATDLEYWKFTWHEIGYYDMAANIDYILNITQAKQIFYIGYSQGGTIYFVLTSSRPEYNSKIRASVNLAPTIVTSKVNSLLGEFSKYVRFIQNIIERSRWYELLPNVEIYSDMFCKICGISKEFNDLCTLGIGIPAGRESGFLKRNRIERFCNMGAGGGSLFQTVHFLQNLYYGEFRQYDLGPTQNLKMYKQIRPPLYNLSQSTSPTINFYLKDDFLAPREFVESLLKELPNGKGYLLKEALFTHFDFVMAEKADEIVYKPLIDILLSFTDKPRRL